MWIFDEETLRFLLVNDAAVAVYGYAPEEFAAMTIHDIRPDEDRTRLARYLDHARPDYAPAGLWHHRLKDGRLITVEVISHAFSWQGRPARLVIVHDVTAREEAFQALRRSESDKAAVLEHALDGIIQMNAEGELLDANPAAEAIFGWDRTEVRGRRISDVLVPPEWREAHARGLRRYLATGQSKIMGQRLEMEALRADGITRFPVELAVCEGRRDPDPTFIAFVRDISERKRADAEILALNRDLEQKVVDRTRHLEAVYRELESFSYSASHDLRSPLRAIEGFSQALVEDYGSTLQEDARRYLERIQAAARRMGNLIDDLLALSRITQKSLQPALLDLAELAREVMAEITERVPPHRPAIRFEVNGPLPLWGDEKLIRILLVNLLDNAVKFTRHTPTPEIRVGQTVERDETVYFVQDNGAGFDMAYAHKLFAPFQRLHDAREYEGTGIGLATVQRVVNRHGGRIWAVSQPGEGTTFFMTFPPGDPL